MKPQTPCDSDPGLAQQPITMLKRDVSILVIGTLGFGHALQRHLSHACTKDSFVRHVSWESTSALWSPALLSGTDLFVIELLRSYDVGFRAEGLSVAAHLLDVGALPLVVCPFSILQFQSSERSYLWAATESESILARIERLLDLQPSKRNDLKGNLKELAATFMNDDRVFVLHK